MLTSIAPRSKAVLLVPAVRASMRSRDGMRHEVGRPRRRRYGRGLRLLRESTDGGGAAGDGLDETGGDDGGGAPFDGNLWWESRVGFDCNDPEVVRYSEPSEMQYCKRFSFPDLVSSFPGVSLFVGGDVPATVDVNNDWAAGGYPRSIARSDKRARTVV